MVGNSGVRGRIPAAIGDVEVGAISAMSGNRRVRGLIPMITGIVKVGNVSAMVGNDRVRGNFVVIGNDRGWARGRLLWQAWINQVRAAGRAASLGILILLPLAVVRVGLEIQRLRGHRRAAVAGVLVTVAASCGSSSGQLAAGELSHGLRRRLDSRLHRSWRRERRCALLLLGLLVLRLVGLLCRAMLKRRDGSRSRDGFQHWRLWVRAGDLDQLLLQLVDICPLRVQLDLEFLYLVLEL